MFTRSGVLVIISKFSQHFAFFRSLKFVLIIVIVVMGFIPCLFMQSGIMAQYEERAVSVRMTDVRTQGEMLVNRIANTGYLTDGNSEVINAQLSQLSSFYGGRILVVNSAYEIVQDTYAMSTGKTIVSEDVIRAFNGEEQSDYNPEKEYIKMTIPIRNTVEQSTLLSAKMEEKGEPQPTEAPKTPEIQGIMVITVSTTSILSSLEALRQKAFLLKWVIFILLVVAAILLSNLLVHPFEVLIKKLKERFDGYGEEKIDVHIFQETEAISEEINAMIDRMQVLDDSRQEFVSNVSHELKTPITSMKVLADSLLMMGDVPVEMYKEFMEDITNEIDRESRIIDDLLSMVKMDRTDAVLNITQVNVNELLELLMKRLGPIAQKKEVNLVLACERQVIADADEVKLTLALSNFIENAIKYNKDGGYVHVKLDADHKQFIVTVEDSGIGIPEEDLPFLFERFYRVDKSHSREIGGTGLGLAIARSAVLLHRGSVDVESEVNVGTKFEVRIPLKYIAY